MNNNRYINKIIIPHNYRLDKTLCSASKHPNAYKSMCPCVISTIHIKSRRSLIPAS